MSAKNVMGSVKETNAGKFKGEVKTILKTN